MTEILTEIALPPPFPDHTQLPESDGSFVKNFQEHPQSLILTDSIDSTLQRATQVVVDSLFSPSDIVEVVTTGSVWQGFSLMREQFEAAFVTHNPGVKIVSPCYEPAYGAGLLALETISNVH